MWTASMPDSENNVSSCAEAEQNNLELDAVYVSDFRRSDWTYPFSVQS